MGVLRLHNCFQSNELVHQYLGTGREMCKLCYVKSFTGLLIWPDLNHETVVILLHSFQGN